MPPETVSKVHCRPTELLSGSRPILTMITTPRSFIPSISDVQFFASLYAEHHFCIVTCSPTEMSVISLFLLSSNYNMGFCITKIHQQTNQLSQERLNKTWATPNKPRKNPTFCRSAMLDTRSTLELCCLPSPRRFLTSLHRVVKNNPSFFVLHRFIGSIHLIRCNADLKSDNSVYHQQLLFH